MTHHSPIIAGRGRYQFIGYLNGRRTADFDHIGDAAAAFDAFVAETQGAKFLHLSDGTCSIWDRRENMTIANWRLPRPKLAPVSLFDIFAKLIARGEPVSIIGDRGAAHFNTTVEKDQVA